ncbi:anaerobic magnesium-protoporphyrin IX monomethyl ester cyclase [Desulfatibacillum alkenivorans DSM 16219]|jgi:anaerobic magnesium-protoporphyrin IX monomethyl ester cyclase|uniref:Anaerobic magnesium-protoporphyrin IX monomethyl ester cyclase n=1 Tax=Desulfatibacillum alkenivorans DSM 16219 TaxID=1121393 RepID=A0A1M6BRJ1_9BACT|nr:radical SAM protein [Desulfatibacillum alkenivorans]SHI51203.1 anaerobic magnesium-protoporphyrin IX monomethyl ester cyclase [Desulfatibacillum alkenivorans DSM 16219]
MNIPVNFLEGKSRIKILFVRSPRHVWPIVNESDNFLLPLAYPTLAAYLREHVPDVDITILDCCVRQMGWKSLAKYIREAQPDIVAIGEKTVFYHEGFRAFELVKKEAPRAVTIAGGVMYTALPQWTLDTCKAVDYVVLYEGEETLRDLVTTLRDGGEPASVKGIAYRDENGEPALTPARPLIENLDDLPMPAYDLAGMDYYKPFGHLWPKAITVQRSRGCIANCNFCSWRIQEGRPQLVDGKYVSHQAYRTKSPMRMADEIEWLYRDFGVRYLFWVDGTWNADHDWLVEFCEEILRRGVKLDGWWAFVRADKLVEQDAKGILPLMVKAGFRHTLLGAEHDSQQSLDYVNKGLKDYNLTQEAFRILSEKHPEVFRQATYITGLPDDTVDSIKGLLKHAHACNLDFAAFHPIQPFPGTQFYDWALKEGLVEETNFEKFDMFYPSMRTYHCSREEVAEATQWCYKNFVAKKPLQYFSRMFSPHPIRRDLHRWFAFAIMRVILKDLKGTLTQGTRFKGFSGIDTLWKPDWYDA